jgi:UDP-N-acetylglucosamine 2-epimerase (non-hydrolysing)
MGTRPEIIKMAPVYAALSECGMDPKVVHTGQHEEMAWPIYDFFGITPDVHIPLDRERPTLGHLGGKLLDSVDKVLEDLDPSSVLVHGDTSTALMSALAGFYRQIPVGHVEAGLRSFDSLDPFPEEQNRVLISRLASWHFAPTHRAAMNIAREVPSSENVHVVGNTIVDATVNGLAKAADFYADGARRGKCEVASYIDNAPPDARFLLVTGHRRENWGAPLARVAETIRTLIRTHENLHVIWPVHLNPTVHNTVHRVLDGPDLASVQNRIHLTSPLDYHQMLWVLKHSWMAITDSGGVQEEAASLGLPVLVTRKTTERPEVIEAGGGILVGTDSETIERCVNGLMNDDDRYQQMRKIRNPYGDGTAGLEIARILRRKLSPEILFPESEYIAA